MPSITLMRQACRVDPGWPPPSDPTGAEGGGLPSEREYLIDLGLGLMISKRNPQDPVELKAASPPDVVSSQQGHIGGALLGHIGEESGQCGVSPGWPRLPPGDWRYPCPVSKVSSSEEKWCRHPPKGGILGLSPLSHASPPCNCSTASPSNSSGPPYESDPFGVL